MKRLFVRTKKIIFTGTKLDKTYIYKDEKQNCFFTRTKLDQTYIFEGSTRVFKIFIFKYYTNFAYNVSYSIELNGYHRIFLFCIIYSDQFD